jgi:small subunit ribosomal protein S20
LPKSITAQKAARSSARKRIRNRAVKSETKSGITKVEKLIESKDFDAAHASLIKTISALDKAAKKKVLHPNTVSRRKSRLMKKFNKAKPVAAKPEAAKTETKKKKSKAKV